VPVARSVTRRGTPSLDVAGGVLEQLAPHCRDLQQLPGCTAERADLFSYRRDGTTGRSAGVVWRTG
jgi:copper oxidase (laccase) domain-containing protein